MRDIGTIELSRMSDSLLMQDECRILSYSPTYDNYNDPTKGYTTGSAVDCIYDPRSASERRTFELTQVSFDASVRLPTDTVVDENDLIRITDRFGSSLALPDYNVVGDSMLRPTHVLVLLEEVHA